MSLDKTADISRAVAVDQLVSTADRGAVLYWLNEYTVEQEALLIETQQFQLRRLDDEIDQLRRDNATLRLALTLARIKLEDSTVDKSETVV